MAGNKHSGRKTKSLEQHLREGTFRAARHGHLLKAKSLLEQIDAKLGPKPNRPVKSKRVAKKWIRSAADEHAVSTGHRFNERLAEYVVRFFSEFLCFSAGKWAGQPFLLNDFQKRELIYPLFGWVRDDGTRRFRTSYIEWPKKNYKSETAAGIGLYGLVGDGEAGAEIYSLGADKDQARVVHNVAIVMTENSPALQSALGINRTTGTITFPETNSYYRALSAAPKGKHGLKAHFGVADELHEWQGRSLWDSMRYAYRMRAEPLQFVITNAGDDITSVCFEQRQKAERIISGDAVDDRFFASIKSVSEADARKEINKVANGATKMPVAASCNPAWGDVINPKDFRQDVLDAIETPGEMPNLLRLSYGVWATGTSKTLLDSPDDWEACRSDFTIEDMLGKPCSAGLDLGQTRDLTALSLWFPGYNGEPDRTLCWHYAAFNCIHDPKLKYGDFMREMSEHDAAKFELTPGDVTDYGYVAGAFRQLSEMFEIQCLVYDPRGAEQLTQQISDGIHDQSGNVIMEGTGVERVAFTQSMSNYAEPVQRFLAMTKAKEYQHDGNPLLTWEMRHCSYIEDRDDNKRPVKPGGREDPRKVDGVQATIMALAGSMFYMQPAGPGAYHEAGAGVVLF